MTDEPERISPDELAYHRSVCDARRTAEAAASLWVAHLARKYRLAPGDQIAEDGAVTRAPDVGAGAEDAAIPAAIPAASGGVGIGAGGGATP